MKTWNAPVSQNISTWSSPQTLKMGSPEVSLECSGNSKHGCPERSSNSKYGCLERSGQSKTIPRSAPSTEKICFLYFRVTGALQALIFIMPWALGTNAFSVTRFLRSLYLSDQSTPFSGNSVLQVLKKSSVSLLWSDWSTLGTNFSSARSIIKKLVTRVLHSLSWKLGMLQLVITLLPGALRKL